MSDIFQQIDELRQNAEGTSAEEVEMLNLTAKTLKRAMLVKNFAEHPALQDFVFTLKKRVDACDKFLLAMPSVLPTDQNGLLAYAMKQTEIATRKRDYEWVLNLFNIEKIEKKVEVINKALGGRKGKK